MPTSPVLAEPYWLPHRIDVAARTVEFIRIARGAFDDPVFLAQREVQPADRGFATWDEITAGEPPMPPVCFIFHTAFCRSTLLARALDMPGKGLGLSEPGLFAGLANAQGRADHLIRPLVALLARSPGNAEIAFVKPTNHANRLMPALLKAVPEARAILMTNGLPQFLGAVARKGLMGRRWGRQLLLEMQAYAGLDLGMDSRETFAMTDMQAAGLAWFLAQRWFALHRAGEVPGVAPDRLAVLDGDRFDRERARTLEAAFAFAGSALASDAAAARASSPVFTTHAKSGAAFSGDDADAASPRFAEEVGQVGQWIEAIAKQTGLDLPLRHDLF